MSATKLCPHCETEYDADQRFCPRDGATLVARAAGADLVGAVIAGRYHVVRLLGEGGMGQVYLAEHVRIGRSCAVKVMHADMVASPDSVSRFNREAANASKISHPNVVAVYDFGETAEGLTYLAMEYVEGESLGALRRRSGALPAARVVELVRQCADALAAAHEQGIVHRDLKPDNILVARGRGGGDLVKVVDFGLSKTAQPSGMSVTVSGTAVGTPAYMSPEQVMGARADARSDLYSLALVAFELLAGALPFEGDSVAETLGARLAGRPRRLREVNVSIPWPSALQLVFDRALELDPENRYATVGEFAQALAGTVTGDDPNATEVRSVILETPPAARSIAATDAGPPTASDSPLPPTLPDAAPLMPLAGRSEPPAHPRRRRLVPAVGALGVVGAASIVLALALRDRIGRGRDEGSGANTIAAVDSTRVAGASGSGSVDTVPRKSATDLTARDSGASRDRKAGVVEFVQPLDAGGTSEGSTRKDTARVRPESTAATGARDRPLSSGEPTPVVVAAVVSAEDLNRLRAPLVADDPTDSELERSVTLGAQLLARATATDTIVILMARANALALLERTDGACRVLDEVRARARGTPTESAARATAARLECP